MNTPPPPPPPPPPQNTTNLFNTNKDIQAQVFKTEASKARSFLFVIAAVYFIGTLIPVAIAGAFTAQYIFAILLFPVIFTGLGLLATIQPLIATIIAGVVVLVILFILISNSAIATWLGWVDLVVAIACIALAAVSANKAEQARKLMR